MKYLVRALKYFVFLLAFLALILFILVCLGIVEGDISKMFVNGYDSLWQIAIIMAVFAAVYPRFGYSSREVKAPGEYGQIRPVVVNAMEEQGYSVETEDGENLTFRKRNPAAALLRMWEDRVTFTRSMTGFTVEGYTKDLVRIISAIEYKFFDDSSDNQ